MPLMIRDVLLNFAAFFLLLRVVLSCCFKIERSTICPNFADVLQDLTSFCEIPGLHFAETVQLTRTEISQIITSDHNFGESNETLILFAPTNLPV